MRVILTALFTIVTGISAAAAPRPTTIRDVPWLDRTYDIGDGPAVFVHGSHQELEEDGMCSVCEGIPAVTFGDVDGDGKEDAIVIVATNLGGAGTLIGAFVFALKDGAVVKLGEIEGGDRGEGGIHSVRVVGRDVIVRRFDSRPIDGACCPGRILVERWRWDGGKLVQQPGPPRVEKRKPVRWHVPRMLPKPPPRRPPPP
jgi:hypothetical protein